MPLQRSTRENRRGCIMRRKKRRAGRLYNWRAPRRADGARPRWVPVVWRANIGAGTRLGGLLPAAGRPSKEFVNQSIFFGGHYRVCWRTRRNVLKARGRRAPKLTSQGSALDISDVHKPYGSMWGGALRCGGFSARLRLSAAMLQGGLRGRPQAEGLLHFGRSANGRCPRSNYHLQLHEFPRCSTALPRAAGSGTSAQCFR
jgi:hypothetical protein